MESFAGYYLTEKQYIDLKYQFLEFQMYAFTKLKKKIKNQ